jgi:hypothetical protein
VGIEQSDGVPQVVHIIVNISHYSDAHAGSRSLPVGSNLAMKQTPGVAAAIIVGRNR